MAIKISGTTVIDDSRILTNHRITTSVISTNTTAVTGNNYVAANTVTLTLPSTPTVGDLVGFVNMSGNTDCVVARNGSLIMGIGEDMTVNKANAAFSLQYSGASKGWVFV